MLSHALFQLPNPSSCRVWCLASRLFWLDCPSASSTQHLLNGDVQGTSQTSESFGLWIRQPPFAVDPTAPFPDVLQPLGRDLSPLSEFIDGKARPGAKHINPLAEGLPLCPVHAPAPRFVSLADLAARDGFSCLAYCKLLKCPACSAGLKVLAPLCFYLRVLDYTYLRRYPVQQRSPMAQKAASPTVRGPDG